VAFSLSPKPEIIRKKVRGFAEIAPLIRKHKRTQEPAPFALKRTGEFGILDLPFPLRFDGPLPAPGLVRSYRIIYAIRKHDGQPLRCEVPAYHGRDRQNG